MVNRLMLHSSPRASAVSSWHGDGSPDSANRRDGRRWPLGKTGGVDGACLGRCRRRRIYRGQGPRVQRATCPPEQFVPCPGLQRVPLGKGTLQCSPEPTSLACSRVLQPDKRSPPRRGDLPAVQDVRPIARLFPSGRLNSVLGRLPRTTLSRSRPATPPTTEPWASSGRPSTRAR